MAMYRPVIQGIYTLLASAVRTATQIITGKNIVDPNNASALFGTGINPELTGLIAYLNITAAPGVETLQLVLEDLDPLTGVATTIAATTATAATGMVKLKCFIGITTVAASVTGITVQDILPPVWRIRVVHSAGGNWTYSLSAVLYN